MATVLAIIVLYRTVFNRITLFFISFIIPFQIKGRSEMFSIPVIISASATIRDGHEARRGEARRVGREASEPDT